MDKYSLSYSLYFYFRLKLCRCFVFWMLWWYVCKILVGSIVFFCYLLLRVSIKYLWDIQTPWCEILHESVYFGLFPSRDLWHNMIIHGECWQFEAMSEMYLFNWKLKLPEALVIFYLPPMWKHCYMITRLLWPVYSKNVIFNMKMT